MASQAVSSTCKCVCQRNPGGECVCICNAGNDAGRTMEWTCQCDGEGPGCRCRFRLRCTRRDEDGPCGADTDVFTSNCKCGAKECTLQIRKCSCCEIERIGCECQENCDCVRDREGGCCQVEGGCCKK